MALELSGYVDPGVYQAEVVVPAGAAVNSLNFTVGLIGIASRNKRAFNEALIHGKIYAESMTMVGSVATLVNRALRRQSLTTVYQDGVPLATSGYSFNAAAMLSDQAGTYNLNVKTTLALSVDGKLPLQLVFSTGGSDAVTLVGGNVLSVQMNGATMTAVTTAQLVTGINLALSTATDAFLGLGGTAQAGMGYGAAYGAVASSSGGKLLLTSPVTTSASDVAIWSAFPASKDASTTIITYAAYPLQSDGAKHSSTIVTITTVSGTSAYTIDYVSPDSQLDPVANTPLSKVIRVGNFAGVTSFLNPPDYVLNSNNLSWGTAFTAAKVTGPIGPFDVSTNNLLTLSLDGKTAIVVKLAGLSGGELTAHPGAANPVSAVAATSTELSVNINAYLAASIYYGPNYLATATNASGALVLTTPTKGTSGIVEVDPTATTSATLVVLGLSSTQLPLANRGTGTAPANGSTYFATYEYTRATSEYNVAKQFFSSDTAIADLGPITSTNLLSMAADLAFKNGAPSIFTVQANDVTVPGTPTQTQLETALAAAGNSSGITEVVMLDTRQALMVDVFNHVTDQCGPVIKHPRRGWYGMPRNTAIGDSDTPATFVYAAKKTLQTPADSPSRGRHLLMAPSNLSITITNEDASTTRVNVDGAFLAVAAAAKLTSLTSPAQALINRTLTGINTDDISTYLRQERGILASSGVFVVTLDAGKLVMLDPLTTEAGGGRLPQFEEPSSSTQKDNIAVNVSQALDTNVKGIVPTDLSDFILAVKATIAGVLNASIQSAAIGPYRDSSGRARDLDFTTDIQVFQSKSDQRKYLFRYFYMLRYPSKRFYGEYSVDNPFFNASSNTGLTA